MSSLEQFSDDLEQLVARASPAVVGVEHGRGHGTGLLLTPDGYVLTNHHVVRGAGKLRVRRTTGEELSGELVGEDPLTDLAVVRAEGSGFPTLPLAPAESIRVGQLVVAIGNPFQLERSVSLGVVSAIDRSLHSPGGGLMEGMLQTDAAINPGNSGGPLLNVRGAVVGINSIVLPYAQGIGFAIPASTANWVASLLIQRGEVRRRYLGIAARTEPLDAALSAAAEQTRGVRVMKVAPHTPAARSGLREGDLLLGVEGRPVQSVDDLHRLMALSPQPSVRFDLWRSGARRDLTVETEWQAKAA